MALIGGYGYPFSYGRATKAVMLSERGTTAAVLPRCEINGQNLREDGVNLILIV